VPASGPDLSLSLSLDVGTVEAWMAPELDEDPSGVSRRQEREGGTLGPGTELLDKELRRLLGDALNERL